MLAGGQARGEDEDGARVGEDAERDRSSILASASSPARAGAVRFGENADRRTTSVSSILLCCSALDATLAMRGGVAQRVGYSFGLEEEASDSGERGRRSCGLASRLRGSG